MAHTFIPSRGRPSLQQTLDSKKGKKANPNPGVWAFEWESEHEGVETSRIMVLVPP